MPVFGEGGGEEKGCEDEMYVLEGLLQMEAKQIILCLGIAHVWLCACGVVHRRIRLWRLVS